MAFLNSGAITIQTSLGSLTAQYKDGSYKHSRFKVMSNVHTDGSDKPVIVQTRDVSGSEAPYIDLTFTMTQQYKDILMTISRTQELVSITSAQMGINCTARIEDMPSIALNTGETTVKFLVETDRK